MLLSPEIISSHAKHLSCSRCNKAFDIHRVQNFSDCCNKPLLTVYDSNPLDRNELNGRINSMWRYRELLPLFDDKNRVSLGEGMTPILRLTNTERKCGFDNLYVKDEGLNPTGSFKARGISMAVSKAKELGVEACVIPTAGNAGGAMAAYCAHAGIEAEVIMPRHTPKAFQDECRFYGANVRLVDGLIDECGKEAALTEKITGAFNMSTLKEPYRLEGKKTMGFEIAEQFDWSLPDVIVYPTGGGTGLIGIWKAFQEMIALGWINKKPLPKMVVVQSANCAPMVDFINGNRDHAPYGESKANGLAVPKAFGEDLIKSVVQESGGHAITVSEEELLESAKKLASWEGLSIAPEGGATFAGLNKLIDAGCISREERILLINTGSAHKYMENLID